MKKRQHPPQGNNPQFRPDIQGMRAVAVLVVVLYHIHLVPGGYVGVDVFFVLSGFLMGGLLLREATETGRVSLRNFFVRRSRRLLPALAVTTIVTLVLAALIVPVGSVFGATGRTARAASLFFANISIFQTSNDYFAPTSEKNPLLHTWSLSVEEQFYFAFPLLIALIFAILRSRRPTARRTTSLVIALSGAVSLVLSIGIANHGWRILGVDSPVQFAFFAPITRVWEFAAGALLAVWAGRAAARRAGGSDTGRSLGGRSRSRFVAGLVSLIGLAGIVAATVVLDDRTAFPGYAALLPVIGTVLLLHAAPGAPVIGALLSCRPVVALGDVSYGWYLWHWPLIVFCRVLWGDGVIVLVATALASLVVAVLSYRFVEEPIRHHRSITGLRAMGLAAACIVLPVVVATTGRALNTNERNDIVQQYDLERRMPPPIAATEAHDQTVVVLAGDSHAAALAPGLAEVLNNVGIRFTRRSQLGCQLLIGTGNNPTLCRLWRERTVRELIEERPDVVVLAGYTHGRTTPINSGNNVGITIADTDGRIARTETEALALYRTGLEALVDRLTGAGIRVVIVSAIPDFQTSPFAHVSLVDALRGDNAPRSKQRSLDEVRRRTGGVLVVDEAVAAGRPLVRVVDPVPVMCSAVCEQIRDGVLLYRDEDHVSHAGAVRLAAAVLPEIEALTTVAP